MQDKSFEDTQKKIDSLSPWYHTVVMNPESLQTAGKIDVKKKFKLFEHTLHTDLSGKTVLDLGCSSGGLAAEYGRRGAKIIGLEAKDLEIKQAEFVFKNLGLTGSFHRDDVMNAYKYGQAEIINCCGIFYHLPHPQLFLDILSFLCTEQLVFQTRISPKLENLMDLRRSGPGAGNWWFPSEEALLSMLKISGFKNINVISVNGDRSNLFCVASASKNANKSFENQFELFDMILNLRTPFGNRIVSEEGQDDLPVSDRNYT